MTVPRREVREVVVAWGELNSGCTSRVAPVRKREA